MINRKSLKTVAIMAALVGLAGVSTTPAKASVFDITFTGNALYSLSAVVDATLQGSGNYLVTSLVSGTVKSGLNTYTLTSLAGTSNDFTFDDLIDAFVIPPPAYGLDNSGLVFNASNSDQYNIYTDTPTTLSFNELASNDGLDGSTYANENGGVGTITAVPEPATWAMMLIGFGMVGLQLRRRRRTAEVSA
jgi:uncharacterized protein YqkB